MRLKIADRILIAFAGILIVFFSACMFVYGAGISLPWDIDLGFLQREYVLWQRVVIVAVSLLLFALGIYCLCMLFRREKQKGFIKQQTDLGNMRISMRAIDNMVHKCVDAHPELDVNSTRISHSHNGITIGVDVTLASGVNIPLTVNALQKQIKQYITSCSGVDVKEVRVVVETSAKSLKPALMQGSAARVAIGGAEQSQDKPHQAEPSLHQVEEPKPYNAPMNEDPERYTAPLNEDPATYAAAVSAADAVAAAHNAHTSEAFVPAEAASQAEAASKAEAAPMAEAAPIAGDNITSESAPADEPIPDEEDLIFKYEAPNGTVCCDTPEPMDDSREMHTAVQEDYQDTIKSNSEGESL